MIAPLDITTEEMEIYRLLYNKVNFDTYEVKYTTDQLVADSNKKLELTFKKVYKILKDFEENDFICKVKRGSKGNPTVYKINQIREIKSKTKENYKEIESKLKENNKEIKNEQFQQFSDFEESNKEVKSKLKESNKEVKGKIKGNPINDKDKDKEYIDKIWKLYPSKTGKDTAYKKIPKILKEIGYEKLEICIKNYIKNVEERRENGFKTLNYLNGSTFFNGRYKDYLEEIKLEKVETKSTNKKEIAYNPEALVCNTVEDFKRLINKNNN